MQKGSKKAGSEKPRFGTEAAESKKEPEVTESDLSRHLATGSVSISLLYYQRGCECFSDWTSTELKKFSLTVEKIRGYTATMLRGKKNLCEMHKGAPKKARFSRPDSLSEDLKLYEIKVDQTNKLRIHGIFVDDVFFLIWLDREHACFPS